MAPPPRYRVLARIKIREIGRVYINFRISNCRVDQHQPLKPLWQIAGDLHQNMRAHTVTDADHLFQLELCYQCSQVSRRQSPIAQAVGLTAAALATLVNRDNMIARRQRADSFVPATRMKTGGMNHQDRRIVRIAPLKIAEVRIALLKPFFYWLPRFAHPSFGGSTTRI